jgi:hypothetical protein
MKYGDPELEELHQLLQQPIVSLAVWGFCIQREIDR